MSAPLPGTRPPGTGDEQEVSAWVRRTFSRIAPRYDLLNHLLSFSLDRVWRRRAAQRFRHILERPAARVLDLCCGTGDLSLALQRERQRAPANQPACAVLGSDFAHPMLVRAAAKSARIQWVEADALQLPLADASCDLVTNAFGFRNLASYERGLREIVRVLRPGGEAGLLEFSAPRNALFTALYKLYFTQIVPRVGGAVSGSQEAYAYLPESVGKFPPPEALSDLMRSCGFAAVRYEAWMFGSVLLHIGKKTGRV